MLAVTIILVSSRWGSALGDDSYWYIKPARDALAGQGLNLNPLYPPLLPIVLTAAGSLGVEPAEAIRIINALLFGTTAVFVYLVLMQATGSHPYALLAAAATTVTAGLIEIYASALSEPLYITLMLAAFLVISRYWIGKRKAWLVGAALAAGLAAVTRYIGVTVLISIGIVLLLAGGQPWREKAKNAAVFGAISLLPLSGYLLLNSLTVGRPVGQAEFSWVLVRQFPLTRLLNSVLDWFVPGRLVVGIERQLAVLGGLAMVAVVAGLVIVYGRRVLEVGKELLASPPFVMLLVFVAANLVALTFARGFLSGGDPFNQRYMAPLQLAVFALAFIVLSKMYWITGKGGRRIVAVAVGGFLVLLAARALYTIRFLHTEGLGYSSRRWHVSETVAYIERRPDTPVMATAASGIYFWTGRRPLDLPRNNHVAQVHDFLCETGGFLVTIDSVPPELYGIGHDELTRDLLVEREFSEGTVYRNDPADCE